MPIPHRSGRLAGTLVPLLAITIGLVGFVVAYVAWRAEPGSEGTVAEDLLQGSSVLTIGVGFLGAVIWSRALRADKLGAGTWAAQLTVCATATWTVAELCAVTGTWLLMPVALAPFGLMVLSARSAQGWMGMDNQPEVGGPRPIVLTVVWSIVGAVLGGFFGLEALTYLSPLVVIPVGVGIGLWIRARRRRHNRYWDQFAGYLIGAGVLGTIFMLPATFRPACSSYSGGGTCDASGCTFVDTSTGCGLDYWAMVFAGLYGLLLVAGAVIAARVRRDKPGGRGDIEPA